MGGMSRKHIRIHYCTSEGKHISNPQCCFFEGIHVSFYRSPACIAAALIRSNFIGPNVTSFLLTDIIFQSTKPSQNVMGVVNITQFNKSKVCCCTM